MSLQFQLHVIKPAESILAIMTFNHEERKLKQVLGTGFLVNSQHIALTAKHIFDDYDKNNTSLKSILIDRNEHIHILDTNIVYRSSHYDITAIRVKGIREAPLLQIRDSVLYNNQDYLTVEYSESSITFDEHSAREQVTFRPATRKGNITKAYVSNFPEVTPTKCLEVSFPVLQGASGAPLMENAPPWYVIGMVTHNVQYQLLPAQTVFIKDGDKYVEETKYYLPTGKAIQASHLLEFMRELEALEIEEC